MRDRFAKNDLIASRYQLQKRLGAGNMGEVWLAHDDNLERDVAVKFILLDEENLSDKEVQDQKLRFKREFTVLAKLAHPNIVLAYDYVEHNGIPAIVMQYVDGLTLLKWGKQHNPGPVQWLRLFKGLFSALERAHAAKLLHRDLKPNNLLVQGGADDGVAYIIDWGIALESTGTKLTQTGLVIGTDGYLDPLVRYCGKPPSTRSDLYATGVMLYRVLTGKKPREVNDDDAQTAIRKILESPIEPPSASCANVSPQIDEFVSRLLSLDDAIRVPSASAALCVVELIERGERVDYDQIAQRFERQPAFERLKPAASEDTKNLRVAPPVPSGTEANNAANGQLGTKELPVISAELVESSQVVDLGTNAAKVQVPGQARTPEPAPFPPSPPRGDALLRAAAAQHAIHTAPPRRQRRWLLASSVAAILVLSLLSLSAFVARSDSSMENATPSAPPETVRPEDLDRTPQDSRPALDKLAAERKQEVSVRSEQWAPLACPRSRCRLCRSER